MVYEYKQIGKVNGDFGSTAGTVNLGNCRGVNFQVVLDTNTGYDVAVKHSTAAGETASKGNFHAVVTNNGVYEGRWHSGGVTHYLAWQSYNAASAITGTNGDKYTAEILG